ncbi:MAG: right-handed parallel beta-helix repeat-containing protein [Candidatus Hydrogenedentes bacterium]|nr:right-handed parallel beta-helix repeat-containing protein [Candidatus Hydrogenedentota bacterium]
MGFRYIFPILMVVFAAHCYAQPIALSDYPSPQEAINANPGVMLFVPPGIHKIEGALHLTTEGSGLYGPGTIEQTAPGSTIITIENTARVRLEGITLTRSASDTPVRASGLFIHMSRLIEIRGVHVVDHHARDAAIEVRDSDLVTIKDCLVYNYKCIAIDDRTQSPLYGYAFRAIDGTGILVNRSTGTVIASNRIIEDRLLPTKEALAQYKLGEVTIRPEKKGKLMPPEAWEKNYVSNWHQGSAIVVTSPRATHHTQIRGNYLQNCAQGIDIHSDMVVCTDNIVDHGLMGVKMTHGSRNIIVSNNLLTHIDLWGILVNPGAASEHAVPATDDTPAKAGNHDSGILIANNQITDYGYGHEYWNWGGKYADAGGSRAISLMGKQLTANPNLSDILIQGNMVYNAGRDGVLVDGALVQEGPRYRFALYIEYAPDSDHFPKNVRVMDNLFHSGRDGVCDVKIPGVKRE